MSQVYIMEMSPGKTEEEMCREKCFTVERGTTVGQLRTLIGDTFGRHLDHFQLIYAGNFLVFYFIIPSLFGSDQPVMHI